MYYYQNKFLSDIIIETTELVKNDKDIFGGTIKRISDKNESDLGHSIGESTDGWITNDFKLMTDEDLENEGITRKYLFRILPDGGYIIVREMKYYKDGKKFDGILDYFSMDNDIEEMLIGDPVSGNTSDYKKIDGIERDSMILLQRDNLVMYDNWLTPKKPFISPQPIKIPEARFTVVYERIEGSYPSVNCETKMIHMVCEEKDIKEELEKIVNKDRRVIIRVIFIFEGHIQPTNS